MDLPFYTFSFYRISFSLSHHSWHYTSLNLFLFLSLYFLYLTPHSTFIGVKKISNCKMDVLVLTLKDMTRCIEVME